MDVGTSTDSTLNRYELVDDANPFKGWSRHKITCYRITVQPQVVTNVIASREETYIDEEGITQTTVVEDTETVPTGLYYVTMMTPYIDTRVIKRYEEIGDDITSTDIRVYEVSNSVDETNATVDMLLTDVTPDMMGTLEENKATIDMILTEILPMLMGDE